MFELKDGVHTYDSIELVHSDLLIPADWGFGDYDDMEDCPCDELWEEDPSVYWHMCGPYSNSERLLQTFEWKFYSAQFRDSIREQGTNVNAICVEPWNNLYVLRNGHHRLMVTYDYALPIRVSVGDWSNQNTSLFNSDYDELPWSGD